MPRKVETRSIRPSIAEIYKNLPESGRSKKIKTRAVVVTTITNVTSPTWVTIHISLMTESAIRRIILIPKNSKKRTV